MENKKSTILLVVAILIIILCLTISLFIAYKMITENNDSTEDTFDVCKNSLDKYLNLLAAKSRGTDYLLEELGFMSVEDFNNIDSNNYTIIDGFYYRNTEIKYEDFKNVILQYATDELFEDNFAGCYMNVDGFLSALVVGGTGYSFEINEMTLLSKKFVYEVNIKYEYDIEVMDETTNTIKTDIRTTTETIQVEFVEQDGKYVVSKIIDNSNVIK